MYMSGLGGPYLRVFISVGPGSPNCPSNLPNGCFNTGRVDMGAPQGQACANPDPQQFATVDQMTAYATAHGETLKQFYDVASLNSFCASAGVAPSPAVSTAQEPAPAPLAPPAGSQGFNPSGPATIIRSTLNTAPTAPTNVPTTVVVSPPTPGSVTIQTPATTTEVSPTMLLIAAGLGLLILTRR